MELTRAGEIAEENERQLKAQNEEYEAINEELRQTNEELFQAKEKTEEINANVTAILEGTADSIWAFDRNYNILYINNVFQKEFQAAFGVWLEKGSSLIEALPEILRPIWKPRYDRVLLNERFTIVDEVETSLGKLFIQVTFNPVVKNNKVVGGSCFGSDITARKQAEEALRMSEANLRTIIENSPVGYYKYVLEPDDRLVFSMYNPSADRIIRVSHEQFIGKDIHEAFPALTGTGIPEMYRAVAKGEMETQNFEIPYDYNGIKGVYDVRVFQGALGQAVVNFTDITERKRTEEALRLNEERLKETARIAKVGGWEINLLNNALFWTEETFKIHELESNKQPDVAKAISYYHPDDQQKVLDAVKQAVDSGVDFDFEARLITERGNQLYIRSIGRVVYENSQATHVQGMIQDITDSKRAEEELVKAKEKAEENDRLKTAFLQNMSHEIRTPMNAIMGFANLMGDSFNNKEKIERYSRIINQRCTDLLAIINDILDISKIESSQTTLQVEKCNLYELFGELARFFAAYQIRTNKTHIQLVLPQIVEIEGIHIMTDVLKLKQIIINLISNAFKFTETGKVECDCKIEKNKLLFRVTDTGVGIPDDKHEFIFERFSRIETTILDNFVGGTGLGLPIVRGLVDLLGGEVWLESECGKGTTFYFTIDFQETEPIKLMNDSSTEVAQTFVSEKRILIVEDDPFNVMYLQEVLKSHFSNIAVVRYGHEAIKYVRDFNTDIILMDVRLPDMSGYDATKAILQHNPNIKIIAQTAFAAPDERLKAIEAGCCDYLSKPTSKSDLVTILRKYGSR
jgi:PAS domain S-box-containing protein